MRNRLLTLGTLLLSACVHMPAGSSLPGFHLLVSHQELRLLEAPSFAQPGEQYFSLGAGRKLRVRISEAATPAKALAETQHRLAVVQQYLERQSDPYTGISQTKSHCSIETGPENTSLLASAHLRVSPAHTIQCYGQTELSEERQYFYCAGTKKLFEISLFGEPEKSAHSPLAACD